MLLGPVVSTPIIGLCRANKTGSAGGLIVAFGIAEVVFPLSVEVAAADAVLEASLTARRVFISGPPTTGPPGTVTDGVSVSGGFVANGSRAAVTIGSVLGSTARISGIFGSPAPVCGPTDWVRELAAMIAEGATGTPGLSTMLPRSGSGVVAEVLGDFLTAESRCCKPFSPPPLDVVSPPSPELRTRDE